MATMFYLASLCFYIKSRNSPPPCGEGKGGGIYYAFSLIFAILAMFTKETAITLPLAIVLYEYFFLKTEKNLNFKYLAPFLLTLLIIPVTMALTASGKALSFSEMRHALEGSSKISSVHYLLTQFRVMITYVRLAFLPFNQHFDYDYPIYKNVFELPVLAGLIFLTAALFYCAKRLYLNHRLLSFSILWFFLTLLPESSIFPIDAVIFEHRLYLPMVGFSLFLASGISYLGGKNATKTIVILSLIIACYSVLTYQRNKIWISEFTLWNDSFQKSPRKETAYLNRGFAYSGRGSLIKRWLILIKPLI